jgi:hypothetical protein
MHHLAMVFGCALRCATLRVARITTTERRATKFHQPKFQAILCDPAGQGRGERSLKFVVCSLKQGRGGVESEGRSLKLEI